MYWWAKKKLKKKASLYHGVETRGKTPLSEGKQKRDMVKKSFVGEGARKNK